MKIGKSQVPYRCFARTIMRWDSIQKKLRVLRICWAKHGGPVANVSHDAPPSHKGYTAALSVALTARMRLWFYRECSGWWLTIGPVQIHYERSYGGWQV